MSNHVPSMILNTLLLGNDPVSYTCAAGTSHVNDSCYAPNTSFGSPLQHLYGHGGNFGNECADHAAALGTFGLTSGHNVATRWIHYDFDASCVLMTVTTSARSWNDCSTFEQMQRHFLKIGVSVLFFKTSGPLCPLWHFT